MPLSTCKLLIRKERRYKDMLSCSTPYRCWPGKPTPPPEDDQSYKCSRVTHAHMSYSKRKHTHPHSQNTEERDSQQL
eukprot:c32932_g1_i1 orf=228-458(-)